jgi:hypothetical protein
VRGDLIRLLPPRRLRLGEDGELPRMANLASFSFSSPPTSVAADMGKRNLQLAMVRATGPRRCL